MSAGLRLIVAAGAAATRSPSSPVLQELDALHGLCDRLAGVLGRQTPSGAWWCPSDDCWPAAELLSADGDVVASPQRVVLAGSVVCGVAGALAVDLEAWRLEGQEGERVSSVPLELSTLAPLVAMVAPGLVQLAATGPGMVELSMGMTIRRLPVGTVRFELPGGVGCVVHAPTAFCFAAELLSMLSRHIEDDSNARMALEQALAASPGEEVAP